MYISLLRAQVDMTMSHSRDSLRLAGTPISCTGKECSGCCRGRIFVHPAELADILPRVPEEALRRTLAAADVLTDFEVSQTAWCPLLDQQTRLCTIYDHRPIACRIQQVTSPRKRCFSKKNGRRDIVVVVPPAVYGNIDLSAFTACLGDALVEYAVRTLTGIRTPEMWWEHIRANADELKELVAELAGDALLDLGLGLNQEDPVHVLAALHRAWDRAPDTYQTTQLPGWAALCDALAEAWVFEKDTE